MEVRELCKEGNPLMIKCLFANEELYEYLQKSGDDPIGSTVTSGGNKEFAEISLSAEIITKINSVLGVLLQAQQFIERCFVVILEIIKQFTALFDVNSSGYINVDYSSLHFQVRTFFAIKILPNLIVV